MSSSLLAGLLLLAAALALPILGTSEYRLQQIATAALYATVVIGLNLALGHAGEFALGQSAIFAAGAFVTGILAVHRDWPVWAAAPAGVAAAVVVGLLSGAPGLRVGKWYLAMISFFLVVLVGDVAAIFESVTGGFDGLRGIPRPDLGGPFSLGAMYVVAILTLALVFVASRNLLRSSWGLVFAVLRQSDVALSGLGISPYRTKLLAYGLAAVPAGIAGAVFAYLARFVGPSAFNFELAIFFLAAVVVGGQGSLVGPIVGVGLLTFLQDTIDTRIGLEEYNGAIYGTILISVMVFLPHGMAGLGRNLMARRRVGRSQSVRADGGAVLLDERPPPLVGDLNSTDEPCDLRLEGVSKHFRGVTAIDDLSQTFASNSISGLIGPNGSGKTTLLNLIMGYYRPDSGSIMLGSSDITRASADATGKLGVARTFQTPILASGLSALQNVAVALHPDRRCTAVEVVLGLPRARRDEARRQNDALSILNWLGIGHVAEMSATSLPLGTQRLVEIARAVARRPSFLLLDEPASGLTGSEVARLAQVLELLRSTGFSIVLVEHNMGFVMGLADNVTVLNFGQVLAAGAPADIQNDERVIAAYLGGSSAHR
ncbi:MAG: branched-chain amino acid ABC transporter ATP-binding protein/permease [Solirubrobacterales bacterium]